MALGKEVSVPEVVGQTVGEGEGILFSTVLRAGQCRVDGLVDYNKFK